MNNIIGLKPSQPFTICEPITVDLRIAATVLELREASSVAFFVRTIFLKILANMSTEHDIASKLLKLPSACYASSPSMSSPIICLPVSKGAGWGQARSLPFPILPIPYPLRRLLRSLSACKQNTHPAISPLEYSPPCLH